MTEHDISEPILVLVRRGRRGRGFSVSPIEDVSNSAPCVDEKEIGEVILEMLDDPKQPRVNINELMAAAAGAPPPEPPARRSLPIDESEPEDDYEDDYEDSEDGDSDDGSPINDILSGEGDLADKALLWGLSSILQKGRSMSSKKVRLPTNGKRKRKRNR